MITTNWKDPGAPIPDPGGDGVTARGSDPLINTGGVSGLKDYWPGAVVPAPGGEESANSTSGLPARPSRNQPSETPPGPPDLTTRNPGTIDQR